MKTGRMHTTLMYFSDFLVDWKRSRDHQQASSKHPVVISSPLKEVSGAPIFPQTSSQFLHPPLLGLVSTLRSLLP